MNFSAKFGTSVSENLDDPPDGFDLRLKPLFLEQYAVKARTALKDQADRLMPAPINTHRNN